MKKQNVWKTIQKILKKRTDGYRKCNTKNTFDFKNNFCFSEVKYTFSNFFADMCIRTKKHTAFFSFFCSNISLALCRVFLNPVFCMSPYYPHILLRSTNLTLTFPLNSILCIYYLRRQFFQMRIYSAATINLTLLLV